MSVMATHRTELLRECVRLNQQAGWVIDFPDYLEGELFPYVTTMVREPLTKEDL